jgi:hypothetical protein
METERPPDRNPDPAHAAAHITGAREVLKALQERIGRHPELEDAITKLEIALSILTVKTGGML